MASFAKLMQPVIDCGTWRSGGPYSLTFFAERAALPWGITGLVSMSSGST